MAAPWALLTLLPLWQGVPAVALRLQGLNRWDVPAALADHPPGAYFQLMNPTVAGTALGYCHMDPSSKSVCDLPTTLNEKYSGGGTWERLTAFEQNPSEGGVHNLVFVDHKARRALLVFRGSCMSSNYTECHADHCVLNRWRTFGSDSRIMMAQGWNCRQFDADQARLDYISQARNLTKTLQEHLGPSYALLLSGHSLGGFLAMLMAMEQPQTLQALAFSPSPFHNAALESLKLTEEQMDALPGVNDRVAVGDPFDLIPNTAEVPLARKGALSCVYDDWDEVEPVQCHKPWIKPMLKDKSFGILGFPLMSMCKKAAHDWGRYTRLLLERQSDGARPHWLPKCSKNFSIMTPQLLDTANL